MPPSTQGGGTSDLLAPGDPLSEGLRHGIARDLTVAGEHERGAPDARTLRTVDLFLHSCRSTRTAVSSMTRTGVILGPANTGFRRVRRTRLAPFTEIAP
jgi:hypothetical protein